MRTVLPTLALLTACQTAPELRPAPPVPVLAANPLAQAQFDEAYSVLEVTPPGGERRGAAFGGLGMLFHAYDLENAALDCYWNARLLQPEEPRWPYYSAHLERARGNLEAARTAFEATLELAPGDPDASIWLARLAAQSGDPAADGLYSELLEIDPFNPEATDHVARSLLAAGEPDVALELLEAASRAHPQNRFLRFALGSAYAAIGDADLARPLLEAAGSLSFDRLAGGLADARMREVSELGRGSIAHERRGHRALRRGRMGVALAEFRQALALEPTRFDVRQNVAVTQLRLGRRGDAVATLRENLELSGGYVPSWVLLASLLADDGEEVTAEEYLQLALEADPASAPVHASLAELRRRQQRLGEAVASYSAALERDPTLGSAWFGLVASQLQGGAHLEALETLATALQALPGEARLLGLEARALAGSGDAPGCRRVLPSLRAAQPMTSGLTQSLAMAEACVGSWDEAVRIQQGAVIAVEGDDDAEDIAKRRLSSYRLQRVPASVWEPGEQWRSRQESAGSS